jgi:hypothetical protein
LAGNFWFFTNKGKMEVSVLSEEAVNINCFIPMNELLKTSNEDNIRVTVLSIFSKIIEDPKSIALFVTHNLLKTFVGNFFFLGIF